MAIQIAKTNVYVSAAPRSGVLLVAKANNYVSEAPVVIVVHPRRRLAVVVG